MSTTTPASAARIDSEEVLDLLASLVQRSLVIYEEDEQGRGRYRLLETVRQYARDRLAEAGEAEAVRRRHRDWFLALAERAEPNLLFGAEQAAWLDRLDTEHGNLRAALEWCQGTREGAEPGLRPSNAQLWAGGCSLPRKLSYCKPRSSPVAINQPLSHLTSTVSRGIIRHGRRTFRAARRMRKRRTEPWRP